MIAFRVPAIPSGPTATGWSSGVRERFYCEPCIERYASLRERAELLPDGMIDARCAGCMTPLADLDTAALLEELADAVSAKLGTMDFYFGPNARSAVSQESERAFRRIQAATKRAKEATEARA